MVDRWQQTDGVHLDLRGLIPPEPMIEILCEIDGGADGPLIIHMDRDPLLLYAELEGRGWSAQPYTGGESSGLASSPDHAPVILELKPDVPS